MTSFKQWVEEKTENASQGEKAIVVKEWLDAYRTLSDQILGWLREAGDGKIRIVPIPVTIGEQGLGYYDLSKYEVYIGDDSLEIRPVARNVIGHVGPQGGPAVRASGRVDVTDGARKFALYRTVTDGGDVWYVVDEKGESTPLGRDKFYEIVMDLLS